MSLNEPWGFELIKKTQLLSGHLGMNMHEPLAGHLRGTVGVEGSGRDVGVLVVELSVSNKHWNLPLTPWI